MAKGENLSSSKENPSDPNLVELQQRSLNSSVVEIRLRKKKSNRDATPEAEQAGEQLGKYFAKAMKEVKKERQSGIYLLVSSINLDTGERKDHHYKIFKTPKETLDGIIQAAVKKSHWPIDKLVILGFLAESKLHQIVVLIIQFMYHLEECLL
jgi:hypothetical protein